MTPRCDLCGEFASEETTIHPNVDVCFDCLTNLIDDEIEQLEDAAGDHGCSICGKVGAERSLFVATQGEACDSCIGDLIDNIRSCAHEIAPKDAMGALLYCPPGYPQSGFRIRNILNGYDGFSYHGTDAATPESAVLFGAKLIECHFMLEAEPSELEANVSLTEKQFARMVSRANRLEAA